MNAARIILGAMLVGGMAMSAADAAACGHGAMAMPMAVPAVGVTVGVLPPGFISVTVNGVAFFRAGTIWYQQFQGPAGPVYQVVPVPHGM